MANQTGTKTKPKCGPGQSCGYACIAAHETCTETIDPTISKAAVEALRGHATAASAAVASESTDFRGKSFAEVQQKFAINDAKHTIVNSIVDHGGGITTQKVTLIASDSSGDTLTHTLLHMAAVPASEGVEAQPGRIFILADGMAKEYTDKSKNAYWNESRDAAIRAAISLPSDEDKAAKPPTAAEAKPVAEAYAKSIGEPKAAEPEPKAVEPEPAEPAKPLTNKLAAEVPAIAITKDDFSAGNAAATFSKLIPSLAGKADDFLKADAVKVAQRAANKGLMAAEQKHQLAALEIENKLYGRKPTSKSVEDYESELSAKAKTWAAGKGFESEGKAAAHDLTHPAIHQLYGGDSDLINKDFGGIKTKDGGLSLSAEEGLATVLEKLARGASLLSAISAGQTFSRKLSQHYDEPGAEDKLLTDDFYQKVAKFAVQAISSNDWPQISQVIMKHNRVSMGQSI